MIATTTKCKSMKRAAAKARADSCAFRDIETALIENFECPDIEAAKVLMASVAAHRINEHPPAWLLSIAPSGSMKTVLLESLRGLPSVHFVDEVTDKTFISGKMDERGKKRTTPASLLHRIGKEGILVAADFGTILSMDRRTRNKILAQLRRIYDGNFSREFGTDENIDERSWEGRLTLLAGATPDVDRYHSVFQSLGERFVRVRWPRAGGLEAGMRAMRQTEAVPERLRSAVHTFLKPILDKAEIEPPEIPAEMERRIASLSELVAMARADVPREREGREICGEPAAEGNTRLPQELAQVGRGWAVLNDRATLNEDDFALTKRAALDSVPPARKRALLALIESRSPYAGGLPEATVNRALEDLEAVQLAEKAGENWKVTAQASSLVTASFPQRVCG